MFDDEEAVKKTIAHEVGCDLSALSVDELQARVALLQKEIKRLETALVEKNATRSAADAVFKI